VLVFSEGFSPVWIKSSFNGSLYIIEGRSREAPLYLPSFGVMFLFKCSWGSRYTYKRWKFQPFICCIHPMNTIRETKLPDTPHFFFIFVVIVRLVLVS